MSPNNRKGGNSSSFTW